VEGAGIGSRGSGRGQILRLFRRLPQGIVENAGAGGGTSPISHIFAAKGTDFSKRREKFQTFS